MNELIGQVIEGTITLVIVFYLFRDPAGTGQIISSFGSNYVNAVTALQARNTPNPTAG